MGAPSGGFVVAAVAIVATLLLSPERANAGCTTGGEQRAFARAVRNTFTCAAQSLRSVPDSDCAAIEPPACGAGEYSQIVELLGGIPSAHAGTIPQVNCQIAAYRATLAFLNRRIIERRTGKRRQRQSGDSIRFAGRCTLSVADTASGPRPHFGGRCAALAKPPGGLIFGSQVSRCLRPALEGIVSSLLELPPLAPNVILVVTDDQGADSARDMPNVMSLARQGASFANAFTTTPVCAPARAGLLTGLHAPAHGVTHNGGGPLDGAATFRDSSTLATWFQAAGYRTAHFGKYLNGYSRLSPAIPPGWDDWRVFVREANNFFDYELNDNGVVRTLGSAPADYSTDVIATYAREFVQENASAPFFLVLTPYAPHVPSTPAPRHVGSLAHLPPWRPPSWGENTSDKPQWLRIYGATDEALVANDSRIQNQRESLRAVDEAVAGISAQLDALGLTDNTIVVFTSDHGLHWGEHRWFGKQTPYEESIRIPMVIRYPLRIAADVVRSQFALNIDLAPTLTDLAGVEAGHTMHGRSLRAALENAPDWRRNFIVQHFSGGFLVPPWDLLRTQRYKYVRFPNGFRELYDLAEDPYELENVAARPENTLAIATLSVLLDEQLGN